ncbi:MAG: hypothetical protein AB7I36_12280 [Rhodospirillaceae bacterium]
MKTLKTLTAALALTLGVGFATAASADTFAGHASVKAAKVQYNNRGYDRGYDRERDYDRDGVPNRYDWDRDNDGVPNRYDRNDYRPNYGRGGYNGGYGFAPTRYSRSWDWDGDGVPNRRDARPRNPWRW